LSIIAGRDTGISEIEQKALEIIKKRGENGIYQYELWRELGLDSRDGSRLAQRLLRRGLIVRKPAVHNGRRTYKLFIAKHVPKPIEVDVDADEFLEIPCFTCRYLDKCHRGGFHDPVKCPLIRDWIEAKMREKAKIPR